MKIKSIKLREAHKNSGVASFCSILWDLQAQHIVTSSSSDNSICIHDALLLSSPPRILRHHCDGVTSLALSPNSTCLTSRSEDRSVKLYKFPESKFTKRLTDQQTIHLVKNSLLCWIAGIDENLLGRCDVSDSDDEDSDPCICAIM